MKAFNRNFILMIIGQIISLFGNAILRFSLSLYVLQVTGSASIFATILGFHTSDHSAIPLRRYSGGSCKQKKHHAQS